MEQKINKSEHKEKNVIEKQKAAERYFADKNIKYRVITEHDIGIDNLRNFDYNIIPLLTAEEKAKKIRVITAAQIQNLAKEIFKNSVLNLALIGPFKEKAKFLKILKF